MDEHSIPTEPPNEFGSRLSSSTDDLFEDDTHLVHAWKTDDSIPSEPPDGLGSRLLSSADDLFEGDPIPNDPEADQMKPSDPRLSTSSVECIRRNRTRWSRFEVFQAESCALDVC